MSKGGKGGLMFNTCCHYTPKVKYKGKFSCTIIYIILWIIIFFCVYVSLSLWHVKMIYKRENFKKEMTSKLVDDGSAASLSHEPNA